METLRLKGLDKARNVAIEIKDDLVWVGTEKGLCKIDRVKREVLEKFLIEEEIFSEDEAVMAKVAVDANHGVLWVAVEGLVVMFDGKEIRKFTKEDGLPERKTPYCVKVDEGGAVWVSYSGFVCRFDEKNWRRWKLKLKEPRAYTAMAFQFGFDGRGGTYAAGTHVLFIIKGDTCRSIVIKEDLGEYFGGDRPSFVRVDRDGTVWIRTRGKGVVLVKDGAVRRLGEEESGGIMGSLGMEEDSRGDWWTGSGRSLFRTDRETFETEKYGLRGKILGVVRDFAVDRDDNFWLAMFVRARENPCNELVFLRREEVLAPVGKVKEEKGSLSGLPVVRVSDFEYANLGVHADFWSTSEHERMAKICEERLRGVDEEGTTGFQREVVDEMVRLGKRLDEKGLEKCLEIFMKAHGRSIPVLAEKIKYEGRNAWIFVANWGFDFIDYVHIILEVIDEETGERLMSEMCE